MFTGIVETTGRIERIDAGDTSTRFAIAEPSLAKEVALGDSIAINGACLTVTAIDEAVLSFDAVRETLEKTALGSLAVGDRVHMERAMSAGSRLDGHIVQGHVDEVGRVREIERQGDDVCFHVETSREFASQLIDKGSVAIDGVSLTVVTVVDDGFHVVLIPHTLGETTLGERAVGSPLNLEGDVLGKYVKRYLDRLDLRGA